VLSKRLADFERLWQSIVEAYEQQETLEAMVTERVKGGVVVDIGIRCFVPASLIARKLPPQHLDRLIGETLPSRLSIWITRNGKRSPRTRQPKRNVAASRSKPSESDASKSFGNCRSVNGSKGK
jgi:ribosomal protein S1